MIVIFIGVKLTKCTVAYPENGSQNKQVSNDFRQVEVHLIEPTKLTKTIQ